jgi:L-alanine-DL-glutamate epimerase-like enolase superfamily enzyme
MMINLDIDPSLLKQALALSGGQAMNAVVKTALEDFIAKRSGKSLLELFGTVDWDDSYNYKAERSRK